jgi:hypothetical protein
MVLRWQNTQYLIEQCGKLGVKATGIKMDIIFDETLREMPKDS